MTDILKFPQRNKSEKNNKLRGYLNMWAFWYVARIVCVLWAIGITWCQGPSSSAENNQGQETVEVSAWVSNIKWISTTVESSKAF